MHLPIHVSPHQCCLLLLQKCALYSLYALKCHAGLILITNEKRAGCTLNDTNFIPETSQGSGSNI